MSHIQKKKFNSLSHTPKRGRFYSFSHAQKIQLFELHSKKVQFFESDKNKSSTLIEKRLIKEGQFNESFTKSSILWVIVEKNKKGFNSLSHIQEKGSIHWDLLKKKKGSILRVKLKKKRNILYFRKNFHSLRLQMKEKLNSLRHFEKKDFNSLSHIGKVERFNSLGQKERLQLFESSWKEVH